MVWFHLRMSDHGDIQNLSSPSLNHSNDVSYVGLYETFIISTCLRFRVWDGIVSPVYVWSWWYSESVISKSRPFEWSIIDRFIWNFYNLYMFMVEVLRWYSFTCVCLIMVVFKICNLQVKTFLMIYQMWVYLKNS